MLLASLWLGSGMLASPALAGGHKHVSKYDVVQGYIIQPQAQATVPVSLVNTSNQPTPAASSQIGSTLNLAPSSPQMPAPSPVTLQLAPAAPQVQTLQLAPTALQVQTLQLAPAVPSRLQRRLRFNWPPRLLRYKRSSWPPRFRSRPFSSHRL